MISSYNTATCNIFKFSFCSKTSELGGPKDLVFSSLVLNYQSLLDIPCPNDVFKVVKSTTNLHCANCKQAVASRRPKHVYLRLVALSKDCCRTTQMSPYLVNCVSVLRQIAKQSCRNCSETRIQNMESKGFFTGLLVSN